MSENWVLRKIFGSERKEVTGGWRKLHNEELHDFYSTPNIITAIKSREMSLVGMWHKRVRTSGKHL